MSWLLSYYTRQGFHVVAAENMLFMAINIQIRSEALQAQVQGLPSKQRWIVEAYYGLEDQGPQTMVALGRQLGCSRQAVSYHHHRALERLRHPAFSARLRELLSRNRREDYLQVLQPARRRS